MNAEFNNILSNPVSLISPLTASLNVAGNTLTLDAASATSVSSTAASSWVFTSGPKTGTPATSAGTVANWSAQTFTDNNTAGSGTAASYAAFAIQRPTLAATNASVVTTKAATLYIANAPLAGSNQTITNAYSLWVAAGATQLDGTLSVSGTTTLTNTSNTTQALTDAATTAWDASLGAIATWTLAASRTAGAPTNLKAGGYYILRVSMDGTGGWAVTWNAVFKGLSGGVMPQPASVASGTTQYEFTSDGTNLFLIGYSHLRVSPIASGKNINCRTDASVPNTKLNVNYDQLVLQDTNGNALVVNSGALNIDFTTTGANALDTGTQQASTWYYGWVIAKPDGTTAALGSTSTSAPTLPAGYIFKALVTAARSNGSTQFIPYRQKGNWARFEASQSVLSGGISTAEAAIVITAVVPSIALDFDVYSYGLVTGNGLGSVDTFLILRYITGQNFSHGRVSFPSTSGAYAMSHNNAIVPNVSQQLFYIWNNNTNVSALSADAYIRGFKLPLGGE